jgi:hypothetical protein
MIVLWILLAIYLFGVVVISLFADMTLVGQDKPASFKQKIPYTLLWPVVSAYMTYKALHGEIRITKSERK